MTHILAAISIAVALLTGVTIAAFADEMPLMPTDTTTAPAPAPGLNVAE